MWMLRARKGFSVRGGIKHIGSLAAIVVIVQIIKERDVVGRMPAAEKPTFLLGMRTGDAISAGGRLLGKPAFQDLQIVTHGEPPYKQEHRQPVRRFMGKETSQDMIFRKKLGRKQLPMLGPTTLEQFQQQIKLKENDLQKRYWAAAGVRGAALGEVPAAQIDHYVEEAAADCGSDPNCVCDWAGSPRKCLFAYCCGTIAHRLGEARGDYKTSLPSVEDRLEAAFEERHLVAWQQICQPEQTFYDTQCAKEALAKDDVRRH